MRRQRPTHRKTYHTRSPFVLRDRHWTRVSDDYPARTLDALQGAVQEAIEARGWDWALGWTEVHRHLLRGLHHRPDIGTAVQRQLAVVPRRSAARSVPGRAQSERARVSALAFALIAYALIATGIATLLLLATEDEDARDSMRAFALATVLWPVAILMGAWITARAWLDLRDKNRPWSTDRRPPV